MQIDKLIDFSPDFSPGASICGSGTRESRVHHKWSTFTPAHVRGEITLSLKITNLAFMTKSF